MTKERGYFKWENDEVKWISDPNGMWIIDPIFGLKRHDDPQFICGADLINEIRDSIRKYLHNLNIKKKRS